MPKLLEYYENLHANPELSKQEFRTAKFLEEALRQMGYSPVRIGQTGVYADLVVDAQLPWVLLRSDMDALPVTEETGVPYASQNPGVMHACGHDSHMAMLLSLPGCLRRWQSPQKNKRACLSSTLFFYKFNYSRTVEPLYDDKGKIIQSGQQ